MKKQIFYVNKSISVVLPTLNEEDNIKKCVLNITSYINRRFKDYEILIVDGASTDNTEKVVRSLAKENDHIKLISRKKRGYGIGLRAGFTNTKKDLIFYTDSDNQFDIRELDKLLPLLDKYDIVSGYRAKRRDPLMRVIVGETYNMIIRLLFNLKIRDIDASFKLYKRAIFNNMKLKANTGLIDAEILIKAKKHGYSIGQIGVTHYPRTKGMTSYEIGRRNNVIAIVNPKVVINIIYEIKNLWTELR